MRIVYFSDTQPRVMTATHREPDMKTLIKATEPTDAFCESFGAAVLEIAAEVQREERTSTILRTSSGIPRLVRRLDPVWDSLERRRARFLKVEHDGMVELADNDGNVLPDLRQPEQVWAY